MLIQILFCGAILSLRTQSFLKNKYYPLIHTVSGDKKCKFFRKFCERIKWIIPLLFTRCWFSSYKVCHLYQCFPEIYSESCFRENLHLRCLARFWIRLCFLHCLLQNTEKHQNEEGNGYKIDLFVPIFPSSLITIRTDCSGILCLAIVVLVTYLPLWKDTTSYQECLW